MDNKYTTRNTAWTVLPDGSPLFTESGTTISINDEGAGEFVEVEQVGTSRLRIDPSEWPELRAAIDAAVSLCRPNTKED